MAVRVCDLYSELFAINVAIYKDTDENIKGAISRVTGKDETGVVRIFNTFKALCALADFEGSHASTHTATKPTPPKDIEEPREHHEKGNSPQSNPSFHYNIQIHLPATTDISVYNAIFKSLKENLGI